MKQQDRRSSRGFPPSPGWAVRNGVNWRLLVAVLATLTVFAASSMPGSILPRLRGWDKAVHVAEYLLLGLTYLNLATTGFRRITWRSVVLYMLVLLLVGISDELYQSLIPRRMSDWRDLVADATGGALALGLGLCAAYRWGSLGPGRLIRKAWWDI